MALSSFFSYLKSLFSPNNKSVNLDTLNVFNTFDVVVTINSINTLKTNYANFSLLSEDIVDDIFEMCDICELLKYILNILVILKENYIPEAGTHIPLYICQFYRISRIYFKNRNDEKLSNKMESILNGYIGEELSIFIKVMEQIGSRQQIGFEIPLGYSIYESNFYPYRI